MNEAPAKVTALMPRALELVKAIDDSKLDQNTRAQRVLMRAAMQGAGFMGFDLHYLYHLNDNPEMDYVDSVVAGYLKFMGRDDSTGDLVGREYHLLRRAVHLMIDAASESLNELIFSLTSVPPVISDFTTVRRMTPPDQLKGDK